MERLAWPAKWTPVAVTWEDAASTYEPVNSAEYLKESSEHRQIRITIGWFIGLTRGGHKVVVAMEDDRLRHDQNDCQTVTEITRSMILDVTPMRLLKTKRLTIRKV
jgi:hypothetical protein